MNGKRTGPLLAGLVFILLFGFYAHGVNPTFNADDSPETAACAATLGIQHPPGYPLHLLVGRLFVMALPGNPVRERLAQGFDMSRDSTRERVYMAQAGLGIIRDHPWVGVGDAMESWDGHEGYYRRYMPEAAKQWDSLKDQ